MDIQPASVPQSLAYAINSAGNRSGVDFQYLLQTAMRESSLNPEARAQTSSAVGLFQFLEGTWLQVMKEEGPRLGYADHAAAISRTGDGDYAVADASLREEILKLREDPQVASDLAAAYTRSNGEYLTRRFGRMPSPGELYIAHFLGAKGAEKLFTAGLADPDQIAATLFPKQAAANRAIFYADGEARTIRDVYRALVGKHAPGAVAQSAIATAPEIVAPAPAEQVAIPSRFSPENMSFTSLFMTEPEVTSRSPVSPVAPVGDPAFFAQLYAGEQGEGSPNPVGEPFLKP